MSDEAQYCPYCGAPSPTHSVVSKICPECGQEMDASTMICPCCGFPFDSSDDEKEYTIDESVSKKTEKNRQSKFLWKRYLPLVLIAIGFIAYFAVSHYLSQRKYSQLNNFSNGLALVVSDNMYGYINHSGEEVIKCQYENAKDFQHGLACVKKHGNYGIITTEGKEIISFDYMPVRLSRDGQGAGF